MAMIATEIKNLLKITIKARHDDHCDQYNRIFMVKLLLACSLVCGYSWYTDKVNCHLPGYDIEAPLIVELSEFVVSTCWIQGFYVYRELHTRNDNVAYFGISSDIDMDGFVRGTDELCKTYNRLNGERNEECIPMTKTFYQQYQYMPFLLAAVASLYYIPYILHGIASNDVVTLENEVKKHAASAEFIHRGYFGGKYVGTFKRCPGVERSFWHYIAVWLIKITYVAVNIAVFYLLDFVLGGRTFFTYGPRWWSWSQQNNTQQYDYMGSRQFPKPANELLPPFGYCELHSSARDVRVSEANQYKVVCELSQHVLYQYAFVLLWFCIVIGICVSVLGLFYNVFQFFEKLLGYRKHREDPSNKAVIDYLSYRQIEYLDYIHKHDICLYGEVMGLLRGDPIEEDDETIVDINKEPTAPDLIHLLNVDDESDI